MAQVTTSEPSSAAPARGHSDIRVVTGRRSAWRRVLDLWRSHELLVALVRKELKVKYKNSALGFLWSLLNPAMYLVVFTVVFQVFLGSGIPRFGIYMLSGLLVWNLFSAGIAGGTGSIAGNGNLVNRVSFPREILPIAAVGAALVHFFLQMIVLAAALAVFRHDVAWEYLPLLPVGLVGLLLVTCALAIALSAINVYARDTQHLLELALLAWFWMTPVIYTFPLVAREIDEHPLVWVLRLNPLLPVVVTFQRALYGIECCASDNTAILTNASMSWYVLQLGILLAAGVLLVWGALAIFARLEGRFAEEL
jgi:ABC-2 type transport system permease protein